MNEQASQRSRLGWLASELIVVVIGVLIAMGVNGLYDRAKARRAAKENVTRVAADLRATEKALSSVAATMAGVQAASSILLRQFNHPTAISRDSLLILTAHTSNMGGIPGLNLGVARAIASGAADVPDDSLRTELTSLVESADRMTRAYSTTYADYAAYATRLRSKISYTERLHAFWRRDPKGPYIKLYASDVWPFTPGEAVPFPTDVARFFADKDNFTIIDGQFDTASDATIILERLIISVARVRVRAESVQQRLN